LKSFGFRGFVLVPPDCRFPPGTLRLDSSGPRPAARVTSRNRRCRKRRRAFACRAPVIEAPPRPTRPAGGPIRTPSCPPPRSFSVLVRNNPGRPPRSAMRPHAAPPSAKVPPDPLRQTPHERIRVP